MNVTMLLADSAQVVNSKLYILGGGWSITGPKPTPSAIVIKIEVPWTETNRKHEVKLELVDTDSKPVVVATKLGEAPVILGCEFEVGRPPGLIQGSSMDVPLVFSVGPLPLTPGNRFVWKMKIDGKERDHWRVAFSTRKAPQVPESD